MFKALLLLLLTLGLNSSICTSFCFARQTYVDSRSSAIFCRMFCRLDKTSSLYASCI